MYFAGHLPGMMVSGDLDEVQTCGVEGLHLSHFPNGSPLISAIPADGNSNNPFFSLCVRKRGECVTSTTTKNY